MEDDKIPPEVADLEELAGTADPGDSDGAELAVTADPNPDILPADVGLTDSDDDSDEGFYWTGSSDNWPRIFAGALGLANPVPKTRKRTVMTVCSGTDAPVYALDELATDVYEHTVSCNSSPSSQKFIKENFNPKHRLGLEC